ncbi:CheR family methyltransferase [Rheinheimera riviphila]|nr:CheR family methyltransferase [Rheinheimera riviphila]
MKIPAVWLQQIIEKAGLHFGLLFQHEQNSELYSRLKLRAQELQVDDVPAWIQHIAQAEWSGPLQQQLLPAFTVGESYFCRDPLVTQWLIQQWLPTIPADRDAPIRIWSAGCCRGEEAYSLLFLLSDALQSAGLQAGLTMVATDLNPEFIAKAEQGIYRAASFRHGNATFRQRYFSALPDHNSWQVQPQWRALIKFQTLNLMATQPHPAAPFELIFCRNVLMYFSPKQAQHSISRFLQQLTPGGLLLLNAVEASIATQAGYSGFWAGDNYAVPATALAARELQPKVLATDTSLTLSLPATFSSTTFLPATSQVTLPQTPPPSIPRARTEPVPAKAEYYLQQAKTSADLQQPEQARHWLSQLLTLTPDSVAGYLLSAQLYRQQQQPRLAMQALQKVLYLEPDLVVAHLFKATLAKEMGDPQMALKQLQLCTQLLQHYPPALDIPYSDQLSAGQLDLICQQLVAEMSE